MIETLLAIPTARYTLEVLSLVGDHPPPMMLSGGAFKDNDLYVWGGWDGDAQVPNLYKYDSLTNVWTIVGTTPNTVHSHEVLLNRSGNSLVAFFGSTVNTGYMSYGFNTAAFGSIIDLARYGAPQLRDLAVVLGPDLNLYFFGGRDGSVDVSDIYSMTGAPLANTFKVIIPGATFYDLSGVMSAVTAGDLIYVRGGKNNLDEITNHFWSYDPTTNNFVQLANFPVLGLDFTKLIYHKGRIWSFGGTYPGSITTNQVFSYDIARNEWHEHNRLPVSPFRSAVIAIKGDHVYIYGGSSASVSQANQLNHFLKIKLH